MVAMRRLILVTAVALLGFFSMQSANASVEYNDSSSANISVQIATQVWINIDPATLSWTGVNPGGIGDNTTEANGYHGIQIENIGSRNISLIWLNATYPSSRPFVSGHAANYDAGNFVAVAREGEEFFFPNRCEYNESRSLIYLRGPSGRMPPDTGRVSYGRFRNTSWEYFWMVDFTSGANPIQCDAGDTLYLGDDAHTRTYQGSTQFDSCSGTLVTGPDNNGAAECRFGTLATDPEYGTWIYADVLIGNENYTFAINADCNKTFWTKWNIDGPGGRVGRNVNAFWNSSMHGVLTPGNSTVAEIKVYVPYGVAEGQVTQGYLTVLVRDAMPS